MFPRVELEKEENKKENENLSDNKRVSVGGKGKKKVVDKEELPLKTNVTILLIPFPRRFKQSRLDKEFEKFVKMFKQFHVNIAL